MSIYTYQDYFIEEVCLMQGKIVVEEDNWMNQIGRVS